MDHAWLMMRSQAQGKTRVHFGQLGRVKVVGDDDNEEGGDARSRTSVGSKGQRGKGRPRKAQRTGQPLRCVPALPPSSNWRIGCNSSRPRRSGKSELRWLRKRFWS